MHNFNNLSSKTHVYLPAVTTLNAELRVLKQHTLKYMKWVFLNPLNFEDLTALSHWPYSLLFLVHKFTKRK